MRSAPWLCWLQMPVLWLAFGLRVYRLGDQNVWWDEAFSVWVARHDWGTLTTIAAGDTHPPLYYWLLHPWMALTGPSEFAIRFPSLIAGILAVALVYRLGRQLGGRSRWAPAALAAFLLATSRFHIWWSQEIRMYSLAAMWAVASALALSNFKCQPPRRTGGKLSNFKGPAGRLWIAAGLYALTVAGGMYSLYLFVFVVAAEAVWVAWTAWEWKGTGRARRLLTGWGVAVAAAVLAMAPWMAYTLPRLRSWSAASQFSPLTYLQLYWTALTLGITTFVERYWAANLAFVAVILAGVIAWRRNAKRTLGARYEPGILHLASCILLLPAAGVFVLLTLPQGLFYRPPLEARYQLLSVPALAVLLAGSLTALWKWRKVAGALAGALILGLMAWVLPGYFDGRHLRDDFQTMARAVAAHAEPGDELLLVSGDRFPLFQFRYDVLPGRERLPHLTTLSVVTVTPRDVQEVLIPLAQGHRRLWLAEVEKNLQDPNGLLAGWLDQNRNAVWRESYGYNRLSLYSVNREPPQVTEWAGDYVQHGDLGQAELLGYDLPVREAWPGDTAHLAIYLKVNEPFTLTTWLATSGDPERRVLESRQEWIEPQDGLTRVRFDVPVYARTPPGEYVYGLSSPSGRVWLDARLRIVGTPSLESATPAFPRDDRVGRSIRLEGYDAPVSARPGEPLPVKLHWRTTERVEERYTIFVQLVGAQHNLKTNGPLWAGHDSEPLDGGYPTTQWFVDVPIADTHVLAIPPEAPPGKYELWAGMYTQPDVKRLSVYDAQGNPVGDHVVLGKITITDK